MWKIRVGVLSWGKSKRKAAFFSVAEHHPIFWGLFAIMRLNFRTCEGGQCPRNVNFQIVRRCWSLFSLSALLDISFRRSRQVMITTTVTTVNIKKSCLLVGRCTRYTLHNILDISTPLDLQTKPGLSCARQDKPNPLLPLHQLWGTGTGKETLRGSCPGTFDVPFEALMQVSLTFNVT